MATVVNFIDVTLGGTTARTVNLPTARILLTPSAPAFHVDAAGVITPETITFTATLIDLEATLTFNATGGPLTNVTTTTATLAGANMTGSSATVIASATVNGILYTGPCTISKFSDGKDGKDADGLNLTAGDLKDILEGQLTTDELDAALRGRIGLIDAGADTAGSVAARVKAETDQRIAAITQLATDNRTYVQQYTYSQQTINDSLSAFGTNIQAAYQGYANGAADGALAAAKAFAQSYAYSKADSDSALTATANTLRSEFATLNQGTGATVAWVQEYAYSKAQADEAIASSTSQLSTTVGQHTTTLELQGQSISGLGAQYTVKIDNNGYMAGYGLASTPINGVPTSSFIVLADRFAVALPGQAAKYPFVIGTVNGQTVIGLRGDVVLDGTLSLRATGGLEPAINAASTKGAALNDDPSILNLDAWSLTSRIERRAGGAFGPWHFACPGGLNEMAIPKRRFTVDPAKVYDLTAMLYVAGGNDRNMYIFVNFINAAGERLAAGWGGTMSGYVFGGLPQPAVWKRYGGVFGAGINDRPIPTGTVEAEIGVWLQYAGGGGTQVDQCAQDLRCEDVTVAYNAAKAADAANVAIANISSDDVLSKGEKSQVIQQWNAIVDEATPLYDRGTAFGVIAERDAFNSAFTTLLVYLRDSIPTWNSTTVDTAINGATFRNNFSNYYAAKQVLINALTTAASKAAPIGSNLISNSDFGAGTIAGWGTGYSEVPNQHYSIYLDGAGDDWRAAGTHNIALNRGASGLNGIIDVTCLQNIPVVGGARFEASARLASHRCASSLNIRFFHWDGTNEIDVGGEVAIAPPFRSSGGRNLGDWALAQQFFNAPANAQYARVAMRSYSADAGAGDSWCWGTQFFMAEAQAGQQWFSAYSRGAPADTRALGFSGDLDSTRGAPSGTYIAGTLADVVAGQAASVPAMSQAINQKLQKDGYDVITGQIGLQSKYAILVGDTNNGVWIGSEGIVLVQNGVIRVTIPISGNPTFAGELMAVIGTFFALRLAPGGFMASGDHTGDWNAPGTNGFLFHGNGIRLGNVGANLFIELHSNGNIVAPGFTLINGQLTLTQPLIVRPNIQTGFSISIGGDVNTAAVGHSRNLTIGNRTAAVTGNNGPVTFSWDSDVVGGTISISGRNTQTAYITVGASAATLVTGWVTCTATDSSGFTTVASFNVDVMFS